MKKLAGVAGLLMMFAGSACGSGDGNDYDTLPLITAATQPPVIATTTTLPEAVEYYTIQQGDTLYGIAQSFGITLDDLIAFNGITDPDAIEAGQRLKVPPVGASIPPAATTTVAQTTTP
jgi:LysM repeat protein